MDPPARSTPIRPSARPRWPPKAEPTGVELSTGAVLAVVFGMFVVSWLMWTVIAGLPYTVVGWRYEPTPTAILRQLIAPNAIELLLWLTLLSVLGWRRAAGLVSGSVTPWGVVPLALFWIATMLAAGLSDVTSKGAGVVLLAIVGFFLAALVEEVAYRGFLAHGLTRRLGGTGAVLLGSAVFASVHIPTLLGQEAEIISSMGWLFGIGVVMCRIRADTGSVWFPTAVHALYNITTVGIAFWAFPDGPSPYAFALLKSVFNGVGIFLAAGLVMRAVFAYSTRDLLSGGRSRDPRGVPQPSDPLPVQLSKLEGRTAARAGPARYPPVATLGRFTSAARRAVVLAQEEAKSEGERSIDTEHLLLGLIHESDGVAAKALDESGLVLGSPERLETLLQGREVSEGALRLTSRTKFILQLAIREADGWGHARVGTEHLLLALTAVRVGGAADLLRRRGIGRQQLRESLIRQLSETPPDSNGGPSAEPAPRDPGPTRRPAPDRFAERSSAPARRVLELADEAARARRSMSVGSEHLLLGLIHEGDGVVGGALESVGITSASFGTLEAATDTPRKGSGALLPLTPRSQIVLQRAIREAEHRGDPQIGPEHILLGLIGEPKAEAGFLLRERGTDTTRLRATLLRLLSKGGSAGPGPIDATTLDVSSPTSTQAT